MLDREQSDEQTASDREPRHHDVPLDDREKLCLRRICVQRHRSEQRDHERQQPEPCAAACGPTLPGRR